MKLVCKLGIHKYKTTTDYGQLYNNQILTEFTSHTECEHCGKVIDHTHYVWNGEDFLPQDEHAETLGGC